MILYESKGVLWENKHNHFWLLNEFVLNWKSYPYKFFWVNHNIIILSKTEFSYLIKMKIMPYNSSK